MSARAFGVGLSWLLAALAACGDDGGGSAPSGSAGGGDRDGGGAGGEAPDAGSAGVSGGTGAAGGMASGPKSVYGGFEVVLVAAVPAIAGAEPQQAHANVLGKATELPSREPVAWEVVVEEGDCVAYERNVNHCSPGCSGTETCTDELTCVPMSPPGYDLGTVTLRGIRTQEGADQVAMEPLPPKNGYQAPGSVHLSYPPFEEGARVQLQGEGGELEPFAIEAAGIAPVELLGEGELPFSAEDGSLIRWEPPSDSAASRILITVDISHHGGNFGEIRCDTNDDGELEIAPEVAAGLITLGVAGFPTLEVMRRSIGEADVAEGTLSLRLTSTVTRELAIPGIVSCELPGEVGMCPDDQPCGQNKRCP